MLYGAVLRSGPAVQFDFSLITTTATISFVLINSCKTRTQHPATHAWWRRWHSSMCHFVHFFRSCSALFCFCFIMMMDTNWSYVCVLHFCVFFLPIHSPFFFSFISFRHRNELGATYWKLIPNNDLSIVIKYLIAHTYIFIRTTLYDFIKKMRYKFMQS